MLSWLITCGEGKPIEKLFHSCDDGRLGFGIAGWSADAASISDLLAGEIRFRGYIMEGFVPYFLSIEENSEGMRVKLRLTGGNRDEHVSWFVEKHIADSGCDFVRVAP